MDGLGTKFLGLKTGPPNLAHLVFDCPTYIQLARAMYRWSRVLEIMSIIPGWLDVR